MMETVNVKKRWALIYWRVNKFLKKIHIVTRLAKHRVSLLKINNIIDISFLKRLLKRRNNNDDRRGLSS
jgi:hypothetical protein